MLEHGELLAKPFQSLRVDGRCDDPGAAAGIGEDGTPGIDNHRVPIGLATTGMCAGLRRRHDVGEILYRAGAQEGLPVRFAGGVGECSGQGQHVHTFRGHPAEQFRKAEVVADRDAQPAPGRVDVALVAALLLGVSLAIGRLAACLREHEQTECPDGSQDLGWQPRVKVGCRVDGERLQPDARRPRRTLKNLFQEAGVPPWRRERLPMLYKGADLVWVPGLGVDARFSATAGEAGLIPEWRTR